mgnify:FL=1
MQTITGSRVRGILPRRDPAGHKGNFGKVLCVCGSVGYTGAPIFASRAAVRTGAGLVFLAVPKSVWPVAAVKSDEAMPFPLPETADGKLSLLAEESIRQRASDCDAVLIGCGLGRDWQTDALVRNLLSIEKPLVLDADGLNALGQSVELLQKRTAPTVLTPHEGEFLRLGGDLSRGREAAAAAFSQKYGVYLVLKGHHTLVAAPDGCMAVNGTGNSGMAKGGSGDVLAGMLLSLLGQGCEAYDACCAAVWLHGRAGDLAAADKGERGMTPTDLLEQIPYAMKNL